MPDKKSWSGDSLEQYEYYTNAAKVTIATLGRHEALALALGAVQHAAERITALEQEVEKLKAGKDGQAGE